MIRCALPLLLAACGYVVDEDMGQVRGASGELPFGGAGAVETGGCLTDPQVAAEFVQATGVDLLAVSVGNVHISVSGQWDLDLERLAAIQERVSVPLVLASASARRRRNSVCSPGSRLRYW